MKNLDLFPTSKDVTPTECAKRIREANNKFGKQFSEWIQIVGAELHKAQVLLASHKAGFEKWCKKEFGWNASYARRLISADITMQVIMPFGTVKPLPSNEAQLRELAKVSEAAVPIVWQAVVEHSKAKSKTITAKLVKVCVEEHQQAERDEAKGEDVINVQPVKSTKPFDVDKAGIRLRDWLRAELNRWPERERFRAAHQIRQFLENEFRL